MFSITIISLMSNNIVKTDSKSKGGLKLKFNSPVVLSFAIVSTVVLGLSYVIPGLMSFFSVPGNTYGFNWLSLDLFRLVSHAIGHADWGHLAGNFTFILLLGPILEERYGSGLLLLFMVVTALVTGILNVILFPGGLLGASGIVFMCILLTSFTNVKKGEIPITFILITLLFIGQEIIKMFQPNNISEFAHLMGGLCGGAFGFLFSGKKEIGKSVEDTISGSGGTPPGIGY
jgi:membrane associated rhomboid family serine protease